MSVNPYAPCPCGSGKKLKFCCSDLVHEIEKIDKLIQADQPRAALAKCEQLLTKSPDRASLLDMATMLKLSLNDEAGAAELVEKFLAAHPDSPTAHSQAALLAASREDAAAAMAEVQIALEHCEQQIPQRLLEALGAAGHAALLSGDIVAARAHLLLYAGIAPEEDNQAVELLLRMNMQSGLPLLLREPLNLQDKLAGDDKAAQASFDEAMQLAQRGLWRRAADAFAKLQASAGADPAVVYNLALCRGWCGDREQFAAGLHQYAKLDAPWDDAVEAELTNLARVPVDALTQFGESAEMLGAETTAETEFKRPIDGVGAGQIGAVAGLALADEVERRVEEHTGLAAAVDNLAKTGEVEAADRNDREGVDQIGVCSLVTRLDNGADTEVNHELAVRILLRQVSTLRQSGSRHSA